MCKCTVTHLDKEGGIWGWGGEPSLPPPPPPPTSNHILAEISVPFLVQLSESQLFLDEESNKKTEMLCEHMFVQDSIYLSKCMCVCVCVCVCERVRVSE